MPIIRPLKKTIIAVLVIGGFLTTAVAVLWIWLRWGYYDELEDIKRILVQMEGVELVQAWVNEDVTLEDIGAHIKVHSKGDMTFYQLSRRSFSSGDKIIIAAIGGLEPRRKGYGYFGVYQSSTGKPVKSEYFGGSIELNRDTPFAKEFPFKIETVQDAIVHYDDIYTVISEWPRCPEYESITDSDGNIHCYCTTEDANSSDYPSSCRGAS